MEGERLPAPLRQVTAELDSLGRAALLLIGVRLAQRMVRRHRRRRRRLTTTTTDGEERRASVNRELIAAGGALGVHWE